MVAVIHSSSRLRNALNYNEQKVAHHQAKCLAAINYPKDVEHLSFSQKLARLENQALLNVRTKINSVHISLNFDPSEKLFEEKLLQISHAYLEKIDFAQQPYLIYAHYDAGHPHIHIVTTNIRANGKRIELHNLGKIGSEKARKEVEQTFGLVRAEGNKKQQNNSLKPVNVQKVHYGKVETKRAIANVLDAVLNTYKFTSLPELNAVLNQYNVAADKGEVGSRIYNLGGLIYRILDESGNKIGIPIKASAFYNKPTLKCLAAKFSANEAARQSHKVRVKNAVDVAFLKNPKHTLETLIKSLEKNGIRMVIRQNEEGIVYGLTYVDHQTKCVFNGSNLGKEYSAQALQVRCHSTEEFQLNAYTKHQEVKQYNEQNHSHKSSQEIFSENIYESFVSRVVEDLIRPTLSNNYVPHPLKGKKKQKRKYPYSNL